MAARRKPRQRKSDKGTWPNRESQFAPGLKEEFRQSFPSFQGTEFARRFGELVDLRNRDIVNEGERLLMLRELFIELSRECTTDYERDSAEGRIKGYSERFQNWDIETRRLRERGLEPVRRKNPSGSSRDRKKK